MAISEKTRLAYTEILKEELVSAMGCTEPIAVAYAASILADALGGEPLKIKAGFSGNIIKNVKSVTVPKTNGQQGLDTAILAGIIAKKPEYKLRVLASLDEKDAERISEYKSRAEIEIYELDTENVFDVLLFGTLGKSEACVRLEKKHTNIAYVKLNGQDITERYSSGERCIEESNTDRGLLNIRDIVEYADTVSLDEIRPYIERQIDENMKIANEGISGEWGACIGKTLYSASEDIRTRARALAAAGSDARMSGCELPVCIISGSGNQGITASVPVVAYANALGVSQELLIRSVIVSDLITIHQKTGIGCLSAYCGAISAGCGCGCGICYMQGGKYEEIAHTLVNSLAILSGTICDGAKPSCAAKIAMAVEAGIMGYEMMKNGNEFLSGEGIVTKGVENTIRNVGRLAKQGMAQTDKEIIRIMLDK